MHLTLTSDSKWREVHDEFWGGHIDLTIHVEEPIESVAVVHLKLHWSFPLGSLELDQNVVSRSDLLIVFESDGGHKLVKVFEGCRQLDGQTSISLFIPHLTHEFNLLSI